MIPDAFEVFYKRCKAIKDYLNGQPNGELMYNYCCTNWHFQRLFEGYLYTLVKSGEITAKFDSLNKSTAAKIEKFIKQQILNLFNLSESETRLQGSIREYEAQYKLCAKDFKQKQASKLKEFDDLLAINVFD